MTICCKAKFFPSPIFYRRHLSSFSKTFLYRKLHFWWHRLLIWRAFWLIVEKSDPVWSYFFPCLWYVNLLYVRAIHKRSSVNPRYYMKFPWSAFFWILVDKYVAPWWYHWCPIESNVPQIMLYSYIMGLIISSWRSLKVLYYLSSILIHKCIVYPSSLLLSPAKKWFFHVIIASSVVFH